MDNSYHMLTCENSPILWQKHFMKIVPNRLKTSIQNCRERHVCYLYGRKSRNLITQMVIFDNVFDIVFDILFGVVHLNMFVNL